MGPFTSNNTNGILNETEAVFNYIENGYVEFRSDRFRAHVELDNTIEASDQLISWTVPLPVIPITPLLVSSPIKGENQGKCVRERKELTWWDRLQVLRL